MNGIGWLAAVCLTLTTALPACSSGDDDGSRESEKKVRPVDDDQTEDDDNDTFGDGDDSVSIDDDATSADDDGAPVDDDLTDDDDNSVPADDDLSDDDDSTPVDDDLTGDDDDNTTVADNDSIPDDDTVCEPDCTDKECGDDGCTGNCGICPPGYFCNADQLCKKQPEECLEADTFPPDRVYFRTATRSFNLKWYVALDEGRIWVKPNEETGGAGEWKLLGNTGMPEGNDLPNFGPPQTIVGISADGVHLQALSDTGVFYRGADMTTDIHASFNWTDKWGGVGANGDGLTEEFSTEYGWSVADSHPFGVDHYEDPNGTQHSVGMGVAHLYRLGPDGRKIFFNDWWLPNDWSRQICGPNRSTFKALTISVSASTMFLIGERGEMYTRLYDFDTGGENSLLTYSYIITGPAGTTRKLPAEDWLRQPEIEEGLITGKITIFQNGQGNAARTLRVEGVQNGISGFFYKEIFDSDWSFQETGRKVCGPFLNDPASPAPVSDPVDPADQQLSGTLSLDSKSVGIELENFNMVCSPARAFLRYNGQTVTAGGRPLVFEFHHVHTMVSEKRPTEYWLQGIPAFIQAALPIPSSIDQIDDQAARQYITNLFGTRKVINFLGDALPEKVDLAEIMWTEPFRVPGDEKAFLSGFKLSLAAP